MRGFVAVADAVADTWKKLTTSIIQGLIITAGTLITYRYAVYQGLVLIMISIPTVILGLLIFVNPLAKFFGFESLNLAQLSTCIGIGFVSVIWFEAVKWKKRMKGN